MDYSKSRELQQKSHALIPGGCHTYAKGDDQFPLNAPGFLVRGQGCHVWDVDGNEFIEYGMGCRTVTLGHAYPPVVRAAQQEMLRGTNFSRPTPIELECAEELLGMIAAAEMAKFSKEGSTATSGAVRLSRAHTGRDLVAVCADHPFFAVHDWFMGTTPLDSGIPRTVKELSVTFRYNDPESLRYLFEKYPGRIACVMLEPAKYEEPRDHFLQRVQELCREFGALLVLDEMITGFRWHNGGAQHVYDLAPDLSVFGKALANGYSVSALVGKRQYMELGGLYHDRARVFLLSTTHGAESHSLAAAIATMRTYQQEPVVDTLYARGTRLAEGIRRAIQRQQVVGAVDVIGRPCSMTYVARGPDGEPSQGYRSLLMQELIARGILGSSLVVSRAHTDADIDQTIQAFEEALSVYRKALAEGYEKYLCGRPSQTMYRRRNLPPFDRPRGPNDEIPRTR